MVDTDGSAAEFQQHRARLLALAYRLLGSAAEAEDAVQEAFLRWDAADRTAIAAPSAWLAKVVTNLCLNLLTSARARREHYVGPWLPEPVLTGAGTVLTAPLPAPGPEEHAELRESLSLAVLMMLERLSPAERAVFVLREAFGYGHREIAGVLDLSEAASRQHHRRARQRMEQPVRRFEASQVRRRELLEGFLDAAAQGDLPGLEALLTEDVTAWTDGGGHVSAARRPVLGRDRVARFVLGVVGQAAPDAVVATAEVNGEPGLVWWEAGGLRSVVALEMSGGGISGVRAVLNPEKLGYAARQWRELQDSPEPSGSGELSHSRGLSGSSQ
ncbi:RNA polymerase sigma-70 factor [Peterkaempfera griseoplana]|uniref:RNA polymerase sigma-70 factor n=1 Tax=Peterkaempfera griseoplana TaxID=66896 RepID=UPI0006E1315F|nr:RNA polymerase sigma-70 factor [Peterkaempfera griseoplana]